MSRSPDQQFEILAANAAQVLPPEELRQRLGAGRPLRVKLGLDPTAPHVHLGWAVVLRKLRQFQDFGHVAVLIVGDFTARIGDPSGQSRTRPMLSAEQVRAFAARVLEQFRLILRPEPLEVRFNSEWLEGLGTEGLLRLATHATVARMLERDDFATRFAHHRPISVREFLYPLLQAYDSVAVEADVELGGTDQTFNLLMGREIQPRYGQAPQAVLTMPLLEGTDGTLKMSQSLGNYIAITEPPNDMFGKVMRIPDALVPKYLRLCTDLGPEEVAAIERLRPEQAKRRLAEEIVAVYHGRGAAAQARRHFDRVIRDHQLPEDVPEAEIPPGLISDGSVHLPALLRHLGLAASASEGRRLVSQGGVKVNRAPVADLDLPLGQLAGAVLQVGRHRFVRLRAP